MSDWRADNGHIRGASGTSSRRPTASARTLPDGFTFRPSSSRIGAQRGSGERKSRARGNALCGGRPGHDRRYAIDCSKAERELGYKAEVTLERGLQDTFAWYLDQQWWWRGVMDGSYQRWIETHYR